jgi:hypothetical protein
MRQDLADTDPRRPKREHLDLPVRPVPPTVVDEVLQPRLFTRSGVHQPVHRAAAFYPPESNAGTLAEASGRRYRSVSLSSEATAARARVRATSTRVVIGGRWGRHRGADDRDVSG